jgi:hypothetical protein
MGLGMGVSGTRRKGLPARTPATVRPRWAAPVIHDPGLCRYYALVPSGTARRWCEPIAECLGEGTYLGVPRADRTELEEQTHASYWAVPMLRPGRLCAAADVRALVVAGGYPGEEDAS